MLVSRSSPFGGRTRTLVLLALSLLEESFPRELARVLGVSLNGVQQALRRLEIDGLVAGRLAGRTRLYRLNPRYFARQELNDYLRRLVAPETELAGRIQALRKRPSSSPKGSRRR
jgi:DNA-binding transcriptional ArsR family regulator